MLCDFSPLKHFTMKFRFLSPAVAVLLVASTWMSCNKNDDDTNSTKDTYKLSGPASGTQERPTPVITDATGTINGSYNKESNVIDYTITWNGLSGNPSAMHFHGPAGLD